MGRISVDLYPEQIGVPLAEVQTFAKSLGGSPTNVAVGAARYGHHSAVITKVGDDGFGVYARRALKAFEVDDRYVGTDPSLRTPLVFCEIYPPDRFPLLFYRQPKAPDMNIRPEELDNEAIREARILWTTGTGLSDEPSRSATMAALETRARSGITVHDLDYRPMLWPEPGLAGGRQVDALVHATVAVGNREEVAVTVGDGEPEELAARLLDLGVELAVVKLGPAGVLVAWERQVERVPAVPVEVVCGVGAGDGFGAGLCHGLLEGWDTVRTIRFANAAGAHVASQLACADAMPNEKQVLALLGDG
jgi:5-dehydro-2-deoxygluconokinase